MMCKYLKRINFEKKLQSNFFKNYASALILFIWVDSEMLEEVFYIFRVLLLIRCWSFFASMIFSPCLFSAKNFSPFEKKKKKLFPVVAKNLLLQKFPPLGKISRKLKTRFSKKVPEKFTIFLSYRKVLSNYFIFRELGCDPVLLS